MKKFISLVLFLFLAGCATPPEVKQLSINQMKYFDSVILAVSKQSEALIMSTEKLVDEAKARIDTTEQESMSRLTALIQKGGLDEKQSTTVVSQISSLSAQAVASKKQLDDNLAAIKSKTNELNTYLKKMKNVQVAIDSYIQSEKAGEKVVNDVLNQPSVKSMLDQVNDLTPKIENGLSQLTVLLSTF